MRALVQSYALVATLLFVLVSLAVALRLLLLSRNTRCKPELYLGLGLLGTAVLGYGTLIAAQLMRGGSNPIATGFAERAVQASGEILHDGGVSMVIAFVVTVFRPRERWAKLLAGAALAAMIESYRYYALMRRRLALGLADPLVTNRFFLWGTAAIGTALAIWISSISFFLAGRPQLVEAWTPAIEVATASVGVVTVSIFYLTFLPPGWYRRWIASTARVRA